MESVMINGVQYVPASSMDAQGPSMDAQDPTYIVDCDGTPVNLEDRVYVRQSQLGTYANLSHANRDGVLAGFGDGYLLIEFDDGRAFDFPVHHVRRNIDQG